MANTNTRSNELIMQTLSEIQQHLDIAESSLKRTRLRNMQFAAVGLLVFALVLFILAQTMIGRHPAWGYVAAFAEAAMIGAMADWFAVVALFRHPLGIPIWHTAIIPNKKDEIGRNLGEFVENHFITEEGIAQRIRQADLAGTIGEWLRHPDNAAQVGSSTAHALKKILNALDDDQLRRYLHDIASRQLATINFSGAAGKMMDVLVAEGKHQELLDAMLEGIGNYLGNEDNQPRITEFLISAFAVDNAFARMALNSYAPKAIASLETTVSAIRFDPAHAFRHSFNDWIGEFLLRLKADPDWQAGIERYQQETLASPQVQAMLSGIWDAIKKRLLDDLGRDDPAIAAHAQSIVAKLGQLLVDDLALRQWLNSALEAGSVGLVRKYRGEVGKFIEHQLALWTKDEITERIELAIGRDLQFIRINGTLVGGFIGLLIYTATQFAAIG